MAVRDLAIQPQTNDLVLGTHGRGIWIIDDITPLRSLTPDLLTKEATFVPARPQQQRIESNGGWAKGDAAFSGENPPDAAVITYYQKSRHLFGKLKIEILDPAGKVIDTVPASKRPGLNRVTWSMHEKPPRVPPAAQIAGSATHWPARPARHLHRAHDQERQAVRDETDRRCSTGATNSTTRIAKRNMKRRSG